MTELTDRERYLVSQIRKALNVKGVAGSWTIAAAAALALLLMACNAVFASSPEPAPWGDPRTWKKQQPWDVGAGSEDSVVAKVVIENGVTHIGDRAFILCSDLSSVTIPGSVASIGTMAFWLSGITSIAIPGSVTSIGYGAFDGCEKLTSIAIPGSVTSIGEMAFLGCKNLKTITVAPGNKEYSSKDGVLYDKNFSTLVIYPGGKSVTIPDGVTSIGNYAFAGHGDSTMIIPGSVTSIGEGAFSYSKLSSVTIPGGVTSIADYTFSDSRLMSVTIPGSVTFIGKRAFMDCKKLSSITILNPVPPSLHVDNERRGESTAEGVNKDTCTLYVPKGSVDAYRKAEGWKEFRNIKAIE